MNENIDIEQQLQIELSRLKKAVEYIEQTAQTVKQLQQLSENNQAKYDEMLSLTKKMENDMKSRITELENIIKSIGAYIENKISNQYSFFRQEIQSLLNNYVSKDLFNEVVCRKEEKEVNAPKPKPDLELYEPEIVFWDI